MFDIWAKIQGVGSGGKVAAALGILFQFVVNDAFFWLFWVLVVANLGDWVAGRWSARARNEFSAYKSRCGMYEKAIALIVVLLIRSLEAVMVMAVGVSTNGWAATAIAAALIYEDIESLDKHRVNMGKKPIPLLSTTLAKMRQLTSGDRRREDRTNGAT